MPGRDRMLKWLDPKEQVLETYEVLKKNQYGKYLKDVFRR